jgi:hypothetical protein
VNVSVLAQREISIFGEDLTFQLAVEDQLGVEFDRSLDVYVASENILRGPRGGVRRKAAGQVV